MGNWLKSETKILERILSNRQTFVNTVHFALDSAFPYPESAFAQSLYVGINLIVPFSENSIFFERTIAIEAKVLRPSTSNPARNANTMGRTQVNGLVRDGFPFVGLVHIAVPDTLPSQMHWSVPHLSNSLGPNGELLKTGEYHMIDPFPLFSAARQEGRMLALDLPHEVGYRVIGMSLSKDGEQFSGYTIGQDRKSVRNPGASRTLIRCVQTLLTAEPHLFKTVSWHDEADT
jgi:hypothetical protein